MRRLSAAGRANSRLPMWLSAGVTLAIVVLVASVALVLRPPAPPGIAEFAPQASKPITKAPPGQQSQFGTGGAPCQPGVPCVGTGRPHPTTPPAQQVSVAQGVPSALQCFTWPDGSVTQTFDPQSPPCIATWPGASKGNGGATTGGVTGTTIRVALPQSPTSSNIAAYQHIVDFFNSRFELYGRHIQLATFPSHQLANSNSGYAQDPTDQHADAQDAATLHPFAAVDYVDGLTEIGALSTYLDGLADKHVISLSGGHIAAEGTASELASHASYEWAYQPMTDSLMAATATLICRQLVGHRAIHAADYRTATRSFAVLLPDPSLTGGALPGESTALKILSSCGVTKAPIVYYGDNDNATSALTTNMIKLKNDGITSLFYYPYWGQAREYAPQHVAASVNYNPEWVIAGWENWAVAGLTSSNTGEVANSFGVAEWNKWLPLGELPWYQSYLEGGGNAATAQSSLQLAEGFYHELLLLASGVQMAGPHLTAQSFKDALQATTFPNPGAGGTPSYQGEVGFSSTKFSMLGDYAAFWFDPAGNSAQTVNAAATNAGDAYQAFCYVGLGTRWTTQAWPTTDRFFEGGCR